MSSEVRTVCADINIGLSIDYVTTGKCQSFYKATQFIDTKILMVSKSDILYCKKICKKYSTTYYATTLFLPTKIRHAIWIFYAFFRYPDELVDNPPLGSDPANLLQNWSEEWKAAYQSGSSNNPILRAASQLFTEFSIPFEYADSFLEAMKTDTYKSRYKTYREIEEYMYGSAVVVGYMVSYVMGFDDGALPHAKALGEAMQLVNFMRDVREDYDLRDRIYFAQEELDQFNITE